MVVDQLKGDSEVQPVLFERPARLGVETTRMRASKHRPAEQRGGRAVLCEPSQIVVDVLSVSQLIVESRDYARHLQMADNLESAIAQLKN